jgi:gamma-glutamylcyclotransferase (GGCT)/AIG2-like uncharacterized protein YtfP
MLYFAYGSNMDPQQMRDRCPGARALSAAKLAGASLFFTQDLAGWPGGVASIRKDPSDEVWGVLWDVTPGHVAALDEYEGYPEAYDRIVVTVTDDRGQHEAWAYVAVPTEDARPTPVYMEGIVRGATAHGLPRHYVDRLRRLMFRSHEGSSGSA